MGKKVNKESFLKNKIKEMKKTAKGKAILKLIGWVIFFVLLLILCLIASLISPATKTAPLPSIDNEINTQEQFDGKEHIRKLQYSLLMGNYDYNFDININNEKYLFEGNNTNNVNKGYKTTSLGIIKYYIDNTGIYREFNDVKTPIDNLYEGINANYLDLNYLFNIMKPEKLTSSLMNAFEKSGFYSFNDAINTYSFSYNSTDSQNYECVIVISSNGYTYNLSFRNVEVFNEE